MFLNFQFNDRKGKKVNANFLLINKEKGTQITVKFQFDDLKEHNFSLAGTQNTNGKSLQWKLMSYLRGLIRMRASEKD
jgi:hypothetical protein